MKSEWISVSERMPEPSTLVLLGWTSGHVQTGYWNGSEWSPGKRFAPPTHWMPKEALPAPPAQDAFEEFCKNHFCAQSEEVLIIPNRKGAHCTVGKNSASYIWYAAARAAAQSSGEQISKEDARVLVNALNVVIRWHDNPGPPHTDEMLEMVRQALTRAKQLGLCH